MAIYYYVPVAIAILLGGVGGWFGWQGKGRFEKTFGRFVCIACALLAVAIICFSPFLWHRSEMIASALHSPPADIVSIAVSPNPNTAYHPLVAWSKTIVDRNAISQIASLLDKAEDFSPNHPGGIWTECLVVKTAKGEYNLTVTQTSSVENGTLIRLWTQKGEGWVVGSYRSDLLGELLEKMLK